ncbi:MAG TPA: MYXO-CTERM sorting domain-containing protein, partial [Polyangia bacterium]|nr:MYXO-CTERM sorting domain-containing protein [Polyangia bacterium]
RGTGGTFATGGSSGTGGGASGGASAETGSGGTATGGEGGSQPPGDGAGGSGCSCDVAAPGFDNVLGLAIFLGLVQLLLRRRHARNAARGASRRPLP